MSFKKPDKHFLRFMWIKAFAVLSSNKKIFRASRERFMLTLWLKSCFALPLCIGFTSFRLKTFVFYPFGIQKI